MYNFGTIACILFALLHPLWPRPCRQFVSVSAVTGEGMEEFFEKVDDAVKEYYKDYKPELERMKKARVCSSTATNLVVSLCRP